MLVSIHEHPEEWLAAALTDGLSPDERHALGEHLAACEPCRALQGEFVSLDEMLLRDFPAAVGPSAGFEARLLARFRRDRREGWADCLRASVVWLLRQRGLQAAGVAAALLALVGLGKMLTGGAAEWPQPIENDVRIAGSPSHTTDVRSQSSRGGETNVTNAGNSAFSGRFGFSEKGDVADQRYPNTRKATDISPSSDGFNSATNGSSFSFAAPTMTLGGANTYTGTTTVSAGTLAINGGTITGTVSGGASPVTLNGLPALTLLNGRKLADSDNSSAKRPAESADSDGSPPLTVTGSNIPKPSAELPVAAATTDVRKLIRNAIADLEVANFDAAVDNLTATAAGHGGFLETRDSTRGDNGKVSGTLVYKLPPDHLDRFLAGLRPLGDLENQTIQTQDVTKDYFDTDARLRNARRMEDRLLKMLAEVKGKMSEVLQVEKEIGRVRADIEGMQGQLKLYDAQVRYATVTLAVHEKDLGQPVSYRISETATLALLVGDVEKSVAEVRRIADAAHAQVLHSEVTRGMPGRARATMQLQIAPSAAADVIVHVQTLGRVNNFHAQDDRTAQNGDSSEAEVADSAKVERGPVTFDLTITHDEQVTRQITFAVVTPEVEGVFEKARASAARAGADFINANVAHAPDGHASATLSVRVQPEEEVALVTAFKSYGRAGNVEARRVENGSETGSATAPGPVLITLTVVDRENAVQQTSLRVQTNDVERRADEIKRDAAASHVDLESSTFSSEGNGRQRAGLKFRLPMAGYPGFIERVRALGAVKDFVVQREDRPETATGSSDPSAPAVVELILYNEGSIVGDDNGLAATLRRTFGQGTGALTWSIRMIGVAVAFLAPWIVLLMVAVWAVRWFRRRAVGRRSEQAP